MLSSDPVLKTTEQQIQSVLNGGLNETYDDTAPEYRYKTLKGSNKQVIRQAIAAVKDRLRDPYSAKFRNVYIGKESHRPVYGEVNSKNAFGGYEGYAQFIYQIINDEPTVIFY